MLELASGYRQVKLHPDDRHKTAFTMPSDLCEFQAMPLLSSD